MGLYYIFCTRCNADGSFKNVQRDCGKCCGTGKDWRDETEVTFEGSQAMYNGKIAYYESTPPSVNLFGDRIYK